MMHFPPVSDFPPIFEKCLDFQKFSLFPKKFPIFIRPKISNDLFLVIDHKFRISPLFCLFQNISPSYSRKLIISPSFSKIFPLFSKNSTAFYILYVYFPPNFDHDAFMHHPMHVLDAPDSIMNSSIQDIHLFVMCAIHASMHLCIHRSIQTISSLKYACADNNQWKTPKIPTPKMLYVYDPHYNSDYTCNYYCCGAWWLSGSFNALRPKGCSLNSTIAV